MKVGKQLTGKPFVFQLQFSEDGELKKEIQILPTGKWEHPVYGQFEITEDDIKEFKYNFDQGVRNGVPITEGHSFGKEQPARGWFDELIDKGVDGLWGVVDWTKKGKELLKDKAYKFFSAEVQDVYEDPQTGRAYNNVLVGGALTNHPFFKEMPAVVFSDLNIIKSFSMDLQAILAKKPEELSEEEKSFLKEKKEELSAEQLATFGSVLEDEAGEEPEEKEENEPEEKEEVEEGEEAEENEPAEGEEKIEVSKSEYSALKTMANQGAKAFAELRKNEITNTVKSLTFSEQNSEGKLLPKQTDTVVEFMSGLTAKQRQVFSAIISELPKVQIFSEAGDGGSDEVGVAKELQAKVAEKRKEDKSLSYSDAVRLVFSEDPEFAKRYNSEVIAE